MTVAHVPASVSGRTGRPMDSRLSARASATRSSACVLQSVWCALAARCWPPCRGSQAAIRGRDRSSSWYARTHGHLKSACCYTLGSSLVTLSPLLEGWPRNSVMTLQPTCRSGMRKQNNHACVDCRRSCLKHCAPYTTQQNLNRHSASIAGGLAAQQCHHAVQARGNKKTTHTWNAGVHIRNLSNDTLEDCHRLMSESSSSSTQQICWVGLWVLE